MIKENKLTTTNLCHLSELGVIDYDKAYELQKYYVNEFGRDNTNKLLFCEHPVVLTTGRLAKPANVLVSQNQLVQRKIPLYSIDRGGDVTLHAPGQLVVYPIFDLTRYGRNLRSFLFKLEQVAIDLLNDFAIVANRFPEKTGVWVGKKKIVSIGIGVRRWISFHGLAINVNTDLSLFDMIRPCGLDVQMTSISQIKNQLIDMDEVRQKTLKHFRSQFQLDVIKR